MKFKIVKPFKTVLLFLALGAMMFSCEHDSFPAPPPGMGNDTIKNPIDTNQPAQGKPCHPDTVYYSRDIQPILTTNCTRSGCHDAVTRKKGVQLTDYQSVINTADIRPFDPEGSDLYERITEDDPDKRMPYQLPPLAQSDIDLIKKWINQGALNLDCDDCDTANLAYTNGISLIFNICQGCHAGNNPGTNRRLTNYTEVKAALNDPNANLLTRINGGNSNYAGMPQGGKLSQCNIDKIEAWYRNGMPE